MNEPPLKTAELSALNLLSDSRNDFAEPFPENFRMILQSFGRTDEDHALFADRFLDVGINRFAVELRFDAGEKFAFLFRNAESLEGALHVFGHIFPIAFRLRAAAQVIANVFEDDRFEILARPMRRHRFAQESLAAR